MLEAYSIGVVLKVHNLISPQLLEMSKQFERLDVLAIDLGKSLGKLTIDSTGLRSLASATNATSRAFAKADLSATAYERRLESLHRMARAPTAGSLGAGMLAGGIGGARGGGGHSPGGLHGGNIHVGAGGIGLGAAGFAAGGWFWPLAAAATCAAYSSR